MAWPDERLDGTVEIVIVPPSPTVMLLTVTLPPLVPSLAWWKPSITTALAVVFEVTIEPVNVKGHAVSGVAVGGHIDVAGETRSADRHPRIQSEIVVRRQNNIAGAGCDVARDGQIVSARIGGNHDDIARARRALRRSK